jgi:hypothetical protein
MTTLLPLAADEQNSAQHSSSTSKTSSTTVSVDLAACAPLDSSFLLMSHASRCSTDEKRDRALSLPQACATRVFFRRFFSFLFGFFQVLSFFGFQVHPQVKNETHTQTRFYAGRVQVVATKMHPNPHPSGAKPTSDLKPESELPSLQKYCLMNKRLTKENQPGIKYITIHTSNFFFFFALCVILGNLIILIVL